MADSQAAVEALTEFGLTEYEARCFVALTQLPHGTAREVGQVAGIPRSRVYETMERLYDRGLVEVHEADPKEYQSVSVDAALEMLRTEYESYLDTAEASLRALEPTFKQAEQGVWAINTHEQVTARLLEVLGDATDEVVLVVLDDDLLDDAVVDALGEAAERGAAVHVGSDADAVDERLARADFEAHVFTTDLVDWFTEMAGSPRIGRLLMVDREPILVSALHEEELPGVPNETAVWSDGVDHGFATFAERVLTFELEEREAAPAE